MDRFRRNLPAGGNIEKVTGAHVTAETYLAGLSHKYEVAWDNRMESLS